MIRQPISSAQRGLRTISILVAILLLIYPALGVWASAYDWPQFNGNAQHSGTNAQETVIGAGNVGTLQRLFQVPLPGVADGVPAYLSGVSTPRGTKDLLYLTTKDGHIVALDAHTGATIWTKSTSGPNYTTSSPAVDPTRQYVYGYGLDGFAHKYQAGTGAEVTTGGWPELATLKPDVEKGSSALSIATARGGTSYLYVANGGYPGDAGDYQGHVTAINLSTGAQRVFNTMCSNTMINGQPPHFVENGTPPTDCPGVQSAVWARSGVVYDPATDKIYFGTGNGTFAPINGDWGDSVLALHPDGTGANGGPLDSYTPADYQQLQNTDADLGSTAPAILPVPASSKVRNLAVQSGKDALLRLLNLDALGGVGGEVPNSVIPVPQGGEVLTAPAVWVDPHSGTTWVFVANDSGLAGLRLTVDGTGLPSLQPVWTIGSPGTSPLVANGVLYEAGPGNIQALDPLTGRTLWHDTSIGGIHWESPIVANGALYITDENGALTAYTLPPATLMTSLTSGTPFQTIAVSGANFGAGEAVKVSWDSTTSAALITPTARADGTFAAILTVPRAAAGLHILIAVGQTSGRTATAALQVKPAVILVPASGKAGAVVYLVGVGFGARETVAGLWYPGFKLLKAANSNAAGTVAMTFTVPMSPTARYDVIGYGVRSKVYAAGRFTVNAASSMVANGTQQPLVAPPPPPYPLTVEWRSGTARTWPWPAYVALAPGASRRPAG